MEENMIINPTDRISQLPEFIIHHILSYLKSPADLVRTSVLSKKWFDITASFPILDFNIVKFMTTMMASRIPSDIHPIVYVVEKLFKYVDYTTSRICDQDVSVHTFNLITWIHDPTQVDLMDRCIGLILKKGVKVLDISIIKVGSLLTYRLPNTLLSASSLTSLKITECELPSSLMVDVVKFKSLKSLILDTVRVEEEVIKYLITSCPLLEKIVLSCCQGFTRVCVYGLEYLKKVRFQYEHRIEIIDIKAPNICHFTYMTLKELGRHL